MDRSSSFRSTIQASAKRVLAALGQSVRAIDTERSIAERAVAMLVGENLPQTWYHQCPALVLLGSRSTASVSGRTYQPATEQVGQVNLVTIDLSPCIGDVWGDCTRSFPIES